MNVPRDSLTFMASTATLAIRHGLKKGITKAVAKANPTLMVVEAASSVFKAVDSWLQFRKAREHRDGLRRIIPEEEERLRLEREKLSEELDLAKAEIDANDEIRKRLGRLTLACASAYRAVWDELHAIRTSELPDVDAFERRIDKLDESWRQFKAALDYYNDSST